MSLRSRFILRFLISFSLVNAYSHISFSQHIVQTIRGTIRDYDSRSPLPAASVAIYTDSVFIKGTVANMEGYYVIESVPVGRYTIVASHMGYRQKILPEVMIRSGKQLLLDIDMEESIVKLNEFEIVSASNKGEALNEMATVSARAFTVEETERYAGSRGDPARMASNFAGAQGADDSRNDIVIRGNSPLGILYRLNGVDLPNPNHFAISGSTGGPVSILNNKVLSNSDFYTGAFPAEFGNCLSGAFDLRMRNGNNHKHEFTGQLGFLGTELTAEGPLNKAHKSSYLLNYRYSTFTLFDRFGINIGTSAVPKYQDAAFKLNFPLKKGVLSFFGLGGLSNIDIMISDKKYDEVEIYGDQDRDQYFGSGMGMAGLSYLLPLNKNTYGQLILAQTAEEQHAYHEYVYRKKDSSGAYLIDNEGYYQIDSLVPILDYSYKIFKTSVRFIIHSKLNAQHALKAGFTTDRYFFSMHDSVYDYRLTRQWDTRWDYNGGDYLLRPFIQWKWKMTDQLQLISGIYSQLFTLNGSVSLAEPRIGLKWRANSLWNFGFGTGLYSQTQPFYTYYYQISNPYGGKLMHNINMGFSRSEHIVLSASRLIGNNIRILAEAYYQHLDHIPVTLIPSSFSLLNQGTGFSRFFPDTLVNTGTGYNRGVELTIQRFFSKGFFYMATASLYESKYRGSDDVLRDTDFNGNYTCNLLLAKEFKLGKRGICNLGGKLTYAGNRRFGPIDTARTVQMGEIIYVDSLRNTWQLPNYFRIDVRMNYQINTLRFTHEIGLDLINIANTKNVLKLTYAPDPKDPSSDAIRYEYQLGFLPLFYYRMDF